MIYLCFATVFSLIISSEEIFEDLLLNNIFLKLSLLNFLRYLILLINTVFYSTTLMLSASVGTNSGIKAVKSIKTSQVWQTNCTVLVFSCGSGRWAGFGASLMVC